MAFERSEKPGLGNIIFECALANGTRYAFTKARWTDLGIKVMSSRALCELFRM